MEKRTKRTNNDLQNTIQKTKYQATRTPLVLNSGATKGKQRTPLVMNPGATKGKQHLLHMCYSCYKQTQ